MSEGEENAMEYENDVAPAENDYDGDAGYEHNDNDDGAEAPGDHEGAVEGEGEGDFEGVEGDGGYNAGGDGGYPPGEGGFPAGDGGFPHRGRGRGFRYVFYRLLLLPTLLCTLLLDRE